MEDKEIIDLYWHRSESAIEHTRQKYGNACYRIAQNILSNHEDSEECVNDTYLNAWNSIPPQKPTVLRLFLGKIVRNLAIDRYRKKKASGGSFSVTLEELAEILPAKEEDDRHLAAILEDFLSELSEEERNLFILRYWHGYSVARIAKAFREKPNNLSARLYRTREKMRAYLKERGISV